MNDYILYLERQIARSPHSKITGSLGELVIMEMLKLNERWRGYQPQRRKVGDLHVYSRVSGEQIKVEIKTARRGKGGYQFCLRKRDKHGQTDVGHADIVLLLCVGQSGAMWPFVVPVHIFGQQKGVRIRDVMKGKYLPYRQNLNRLEFGV